MKTNLENKNDSSSDLDSFKIFLNEKIKEKKISSWYLSSHRIRRNNIYLERNYKIESILKSKREQREFNIFREEGENIFESSFSAQFDASLEELKKKFEDALFTCSLSKSKRYILPILGDDMLDDGDIDYSIFIDNKFLNEFDNSDLNIFLSKKIETFKDIIQKYSNDKMSFEMNYLEFFTKIFEDELESFEGVKKSFKKNSAYIEFVITAKDIPSNKEFEHIVYQKINDIYDFDFESFLKNQINFAGDSLIAGINNHIPNFKGKVLFSNIATVDFFLTDLSLSPFLVHCGARIKYLNVSRYEIGKHIVNWKKDKLTVYSNPLMKKNAGSIPYDSLGISAKKICLINNGVFENYISSKQYADYLKIKPSGPLGVIQVDEGSKTKNDLYDEEEYVEIVSFASFNPDSFSGDVSAEIRLAYHCKGGEKIPFRGGLFSGNIFKLMEDMEISKEKINVPSYEGPKILKFYEGEIVGF
jgi:predicted Zn-dependent protease